MKHLLTALALAAALVPSAQAAVYTQVLPDKSSIEFSYSQMGVPMDGRFRKFSSQLGFDPAQPAAAKVAIDVDLASIDTGTPELDTEAAARTGSTSSRSRRRASSRRASSRSAATATRSRAS